MEANLSLRNLLKRWCVLCLLLIQLAAGFGVYLPAERFLWKQASDHQLRTISNFWKNRPEVMGGPGLGAGMLRSQENPLVQLAMALERDSKNRPPFRIWGPIFAEIANRVAVCQEVRLYDQAGSLIYQRGSSGQPAFSQAEMVEVSRRRQPQQYHRMTGSSEAKVVLLFPMDDLGVLEAVSDASSLRQQLQSLAIFLVLGNALGFLAGWGLLAWLAERICQPLEQLLGASRKLGQGQLETRCSIQNGPSELMTLGRVFDEMAERLQSTFEQQSQFVADASHELRTPLTSLSGMTEILELGRENLSQDQLKAVATLRLQLLCMERLTGDLLLLSQAAVSPGSHPPLCLNDLLEELLDELSMTPGAPQVDQHLPSGLWVHGPEDRIYRIFSNLLENARRYGGNRIGLECKLEKQSAIIRLQDNGPGVESRHLPYLCQRFYRADGSRDRRTGGTGLGLAIVESLVRSQGGSLRLESQPGQGFCAIVRLPISLERT